MGDPIIPPTFFGVVESGVYRSEYPRLEHLPFLSTLNLRTVVLLSIEGLPHAVGKRLTRHGHGAPAANSDPQAKNQKTEGAAPREEKHEGKPKKKQGTTLSDGDFSPSPLTSIVHPVSSLWESQQEITEQMVHAVLFYVLNTDYHPLMITCPTGNFQTNVVVGCLRRLQRWSVVSALEECTLFLPPDGLERELRRDVVESIESFNIQDAVLDPDGLRWLLPHHQTSSSSVSAGSSTTTVPKHGTVTPGSLTPGSLRPAPGTPGKSPAPRVTPTGQFTFPGLPNETSCGDGLTPLALPNSPSGESSSVPQDVDKLLDGPILPRWFQNHIDVDKEDMRTLLTLATGSAENKQMDQQGRGKIVEAINNGHFEEGSATLLEACHQENRKVEIKSVKDPCLRFLRNPPTTSVGVKWSKDELVEEDDD